MWADIEENYNTLEERNYFGKKSIRHILKQKQQQKNTQIETNKIPSKGESLRCLCSESVLQDLPPSSSEKTKTSSLPRDNAKTLEGHWLWTRTCSGGWVEVGVQVVVSRLRPLRGKVDVILVHEAGGCVLPIVLPDEGVGRGQGQQLQAVGGGVAPATVVTKKSKQEDDNFVVDSPQNQECKPWEVRLVGILLLN